MTATYGDMQTAISRELVNRTDLTTEIKAAIQSAISHYQKHKWYFSEDQETASTVNGQATLALPSTFGFIDAATIIYSTYPIRMERRDWKTMTDFIVNSTQIVGQPTDYAIHDNQLWFWPVPNGAYTVTLWENIQNAPPSADSDTSNWTDVAVAEELIRSRAVADLKANVLKDQDARQEAALMLQMREPFMSFREQLAYNNLHGYSIIRVASNRVRPSPF